MLLTCDRIAHDRVRLRNRKTYWMLELALAFGRVAHHVQLLRADLPRWDGQRHSYALCAVQEGLRVAVVEALLEPGGGNEGATHVMPKQKHAGHAEQAPRALAEHRSVLRSGWRRAAARRDLCGKEERAQGLFFVVQLIRMGPRSIGSRGVLIRVAEWVALGGCGVASRAGAGGGFRGPNLWPARVERPC